MQFYIVKLGDTLSSIAREYNLNLKRLMADNNLTNDSQLAVGQCLLIMLPLVTHYVEPGENVTSIARSYGLTLNQLLRNNTTLKYPYLLHPGEEIVISYNTNPSKKIETNGYTYPYIQDSVLRQTLPSLTYVSIFSYGFTMSGSLIPIEDEPLIETALSYKTKPVMVFSNINESQRFNSDLAAKLFNDAEFQDTIIQEIINIMNLKNYQAFDIDIEYVRPEDKEGFIAFVQRISSLMSELGYPVFIALAPKTSSTQQGLLYEAHDYEALGKLVDGVLLMTYEWGFTYGPPMAVSPVNKVRQVIEYAITQIPKSKIIMGMPNYGYDWKLPFVPGESRAYSISNQNAVRTASEYGSEIMFDEVAQAPFFHYTDDDGSSHVVWFQDPRSVAAQGMLIEEYDLRGAGCWNILNFFPQLWLILSNLYII